MSNYELQKLVRDVNRDPARREAFKATPDAFFAEYDLTGREREALLRFDIGELYALGVHGLLLRPFTILRGVPEAEYLKQIRKESTP